VVVTNAELAQRVAKLSIELDDAERDASRLDGENRCLKATIADLRQRLAASDADADAAFRRVDELLLELEGVAV
jgi:hypothetical protein